LVLVAVRVLVGALVASRRCDDPKATVPLCRINDPFPY
jgi:hypothetical protein